MATTASPIPLGNTGGSIRLPLRSMRPAQVNMVGQPRKNSPPTRSAHMQRNATNGDDDSSDDENMAPVLSAAAEELLGGQSSQGLRQSLSTAVPRQNPSRNYAEYAGGSPVGRESAMERHDFQQQRGQSPHHQAESILRSKSPRIVRVGSVSRNGSPGAALLRKARSAESAYGSPAQREARDYKTPAPVQRPRSFVSNEDGSPIGSGRQTSGEPRSAYHGSSGKDTAYSSSGGAEVREGLSQGTVARENGMHSALRIKRLGQGTFLRGPARRGIIRRQSEEEQSPLQRNSADYRDLYATAEKSAEENESPIEEHAPSKVRFAGADVPQSVEDHHISPHASILDTERKMTEHASQPASAQHRQRAESMLQHAIRDLPSRQDKENQPPASQKRTQPAPDVLAGPPMKPSVPVSTTQRHASPDRAPLNSKSANTPLRPAPPPPKMSVVDTATAAAGAMAAQKRKKQATASMTVNGRRYTRLDCIGRGGSGKVFRVMAENYKLYALKRVSLEGMDELAIRGFKGEINLLQKLKDVDRVVRLIDYEVNDERQTLTVLMEMGELDLKKLLDPRLDEETGAFDVTFTRHIWKEMLECVQSVHEHDVVHSDLKPANFVMVQGKLKLIDFGIANAIADDTVNVHREQQIGTPNYMAPEALVDTNAHARGTAGAVKLMKLGKPSDVWSLGCILYQIVYGKPPFGQIQATHSKVMAIVSERHQIDFPERGLRGAPVPLGLLRTLKRCLSRDQTLRPSIPELLGERDPFLHPDAEGLIPLNADILGMIQRKLVSIIQQRGNKIPDQGELVMWQSNMFENVRNAIKEGKLPL